MQSDTLPERARDCLQKVDALLAEIDALTFSTHSHQSTLSARVSAWARHTLAYLDAIVPSLDRDAESPPSTPLLKQETPADVAPVWIDTRPKSTTMLFVANLPLHMDDAQLAALFAAYGCENATVVRKRNGASKGFGFVRVLDATQHARALQDMHEYLLEDRQLIVKAALEYD